jgi:hypothetical protein
MESAKKLIEKLKGKPVALGFVIILLLVLIIGIVILGGLLLIFGLNLMGFGIPYTIKTVIGASIVISCLRPIGISKK